MGYLLAKRCTKGTGKKSVNRIVRKSDVIPSRVRAELEKNKLEAAIPPSASGNWRRESKVIWRVAVSPSIGTIPIAFNEE